MFRFPFGFEGGVGVKSYVLNFFKFCWKSHIAMPVTVLASFFSLNAFALNDASEILKQEQDIERFRNLPQSIPEPLKVEKESREQAEQAKIYVKEFRLEGEIKEFKQEQLLALLSEYVGKELTFTQIQDAAKKIADFYVSNGYFLARAVIPKQEVVDGVVIIQVSEGKLDTQKPFKINGTNLRFKEARVSGHLDQAIGGKLTQPRLERGILNINDNPGLGASASVEAGDEPGTSRVVLDVTEGPRFDGTVTADNFGSRYTGSHKLTGSFNLNDPFRYGDQVNLTLITVPNEAFRMEKLGYAFPIGLDGLRAGVSYTDMYFELGKEITTNPVSLGKAQNFNLNLRYPVYRTALTALYLGGTYDWKASYSEASGVATSNKVVNVGNLNLTLEHTDAFLGGGFSQVQLGYTHGNLDLSKNQSNFSDDQSDAGAHTNGDYDKYSLQILRLQRGSEKLTFQFLLNAQAAGKNLDGGEKITLGGPTGIRGYPAGEGSGDNGFRFAGDAKYVLATATKIGDISGSLFYDYGRISQYDDPSRITMTTPNTFHLASWGVALDMYATGKYSAKLGWAQAIGSNPVANNGKNSDGLSNMSRFWLMGTVNF